MKTYIVTTSWDSEPLQIVAGIYTTENEKKAMYEAYLDWRQELDLEFIEFVKCHHVRRLPELDGIYINIGGKDLPEEIFEESELNPEGGVLNTDLLKSWALEVQE